MNDKWPPPAGSTPEDGPATSSNGASQGSEASRNPPSHGQVARHDRLSDEMLEPYEELFRDRSPHPNHPTPPGIGSASTRGSDVTTPRPMLQPGDVANAYPPPPQQLPPPGARPPQQPRKPRWRRVLKLILIGLLVYFVILAGLFTFSVNKIDAMPDAQIPQTAGRNYLLVGSDGRQDLTPEERKELHVGNDEGNRTDTIMILHVPTLGTPTLVSIPRDSWVPIPGYGSNKINAAFAFGGPPLLIQTVEQTTGLHIDNYVEIGMIGIARITDALGGVTLCPDRDYKDQDSNLDVKEGCQKMDGKTALAYVRMRKADPRGDEGRAERQREYVQAAVLKLVNPLTWLNPFKMISVATTLGSSLTVDNDTGIYDQARLGIAMGMISVGWGESTAVPVADDSFWVDGQQAVKWDTPKAIELFSSLGADFTASQ